MMLGKRKQTTAPWKKGTLKKWPKKKDHNSDQGIIQRQYQLDHRHQMQRSNGMIKLGYQPSTMYHHQSPVHAAVGSLNLISQGDQGDNRNGQKIMVRSIDLRGTVEVAKHSGSDFDDLKCETHYFRWILMIDTQANGAFPNLTDVFEENPTGGDQFDIYNSPQGNWQIQNLNGQGPKNQ